MATNPRIPKKDPTSAAGNERNSVVMAENPEGPFFIRSKIWFEDSSGKVIFGLGRLKMLEAIERDGSIQAAAKELKMSYRALWGRITATEKRMGRQLLTRIVGGSSGGGSRLTPFAKTLLESFREIHRRIAIESDRLYQTEVLPEITRPDD
ncbi:MAG: LysR family transcriptional regulator [Thermodesulfobacteriota bacterium]